VQWNCSEGSEGVCTPKHFLACEADADCGTGFECLAGGERCTCDGTGVGMGGAGGSATDGGSAGMGSCSCGPSHYCSLVTVQCESAADCPPQFSCEADPCSSCDNPMAPDCTPDPSAAHVCQPPAYLQYYPSCPSGGGGTDGGTAGAGGSGMGTGGSSSGGESQDGGIDDNGNPGGGAGGSGNGGPSSGGAGNGGHHHHGRLPHLGCSTTASTTDAWSSLALLFVSLALLRRRR
jgi:uncharacterized protein (TIGR03382 family)